MMRSVVAAAWVWMGLASGLAWAVMPAPKGSSEARLGRIGPQRLTFSHDGDRYLAAGADFRLSVSSGLTLLHYAEGFGDVDQWFRKEELRLELVGAAVRAAGVAQDNWVGFAAVYPLIDMECGGTVDRLDFRFFAAPGADTSLIRIRLSGYGKLRVQPDGSVQIETPTGRARVHKPVFQDPIDGTWRSFPGRFETGPRSVRFRPFVN